MPAPRLYMPWLLSAGRTCELTPITSLDFRVPCVALFAALAVSTSVAPLSWTCMTGNYAWAVAVSQNGQYVIAGSDDGRAYFFETNNASGKPILVVEAEGYVRHVAIWGNGVIAAAADMGGNIFLLQHDGLDQISVFRSNSSTDALVMSRNGQHIASGHKNGAIYLFKTSSDLAPVWTTYLPGGVLALSIDSNVLTASSSRGGLYFFETSSSAPAWTFRDFTTFPFVASSEDAHRIVVGGSDGRVSLLGESGNLLDEHDLRGAVSSLSLSSLRNRVVVGSTGGDVTLLSIGEALDELGSLALDKPVATGAISENGETICIAEMDGTIHTYGESLANERWTYVTSSIVHSVSISDDGKVIAAAADSGKIYLFSEGLNSNPSRITTEVLQASAVVAICVAVLATAVTYSAMRKQRLGVKPKV